MRVLAVIHLVIGGLGCLVAASVSAGLWLSSDPGSAMASAYLMPAACFVVAAFLLPQLMGGIGLLRNKRWASGVAFAVSVVYLALFPIGTVLGAFGLWALHHDQDGIATAKPGLRGHAGANPRRPMFTMVGIAIAIVLAIALAIALALAAARWAVSATSWGSASGSSGMLPTVGSVALLLGLLAAATGAARRFLHRRTLRQSRATRTAEFNSRVAELRRDPATCRYASLIEVGEAWSDEQIAYDRDPSALATCIHLQAIERVMRERGIALRLRRGLNVEAECRVAPSRLERRCRPSPSVIYTEYYESDGLERGEPVAALCCPECQSRIAVVHPDRAAVDTTWFPGAQVVRDE